MINNYMKSRAVDDAVYWGNPEATSTGYTVYGTASEIKVRWVESSELIVLRTGREVTSLATIWAVDDLEEGGVLYKGKLEDLTAEQQADPRKIPNAYEIRIFSKTPALAMRGQYVRKITLTR